MDEDAAARWTRLRDVFDSAIEEPVESRAALVARLTDGEETLRREVMDLLEQHNDGAKLLGDEPALLLQSLQDAPHTDRVGERIGPYRVLREIAFGGMGAVYEAARDDAEYEKRVAIKLIRPGLDGLGMVRRFRRERQILAALGHANIAGLLDGGITSDGLPYLVMEFVNGRTIDEYCDENRLGIRERVRLFLSVCDAVEHAHRNLVVHRDLKPGNILVTEEGVPKLLDFGVAKLLNDSSTISEQATTTDARFLTPEFASPEQLRDEPITTASDVYSLGLVLYGLLTGRRPFSGPVRSAAAIDRILTTQPLAPSTVITREAALERNEPDETRLRRRLAGDLDNIVLKAIRKELARRYLSVTELADDLRRYLEGMPVLARGDTVGYRMHKFVGRHRTAVAAAALLFLSLIGGMVTTTWQAQRARAAYAAAKDQRAKAEQVTLFLEDVIGSADPSWYSNGPRPGAQTTLIETIERASRNIGAEFKGQPDVEATIRRTLGNTYQALGMADSAEVQLTMALALRRRAQSGPSLDLARDLRDLAAAHFQKGDYIGDASLLREAMKTHAAIGDTSSVYLAIAANDLSVALARLGRFAEAESLLVRALTLHRRQFGEAHPSVANELSNLAALRSARGDLVSADRYLEQALRIFDRTSGGALERATALISLGVVRKWRGAHSESDSLLREGLASLERVVGSQHPSLVVARTELAYNDYLTGKEHDAFGEITRALAMAEKGGISPTHPEMARLQTVRGLILTSIGHSAEAEPVLMRAVEIRRRVFGETDARTAETTGVLGLAFAANGKWSAAKPLLERCRVEMTRIYGANDPRTVLAGLWEAESKAKFGH